MFDIDGTIREGDVVDGEILQMIGALNAQRKPVSFVTNGTIEQTEALLTALSGLKHPECLLIYTENGLVQTTLKDWLNGEAPHGTYLLSDDMEKLHQNPGILTTALQQCIRQRRFSIEIRKSDLLTLLQVNLLAQGLDIDVVDSNHSLTLVAKKFSKRMALDHFIAQFNIDRSDSVFRIGDQGQPNGNDHEFLKGRGGFSSGNVDVQNLFPVPVFDREGRILKSIHATREALRQITSYL